MLTAIDHQLFHFINQDVANPILDFICPIWRSKSTWFPFYALGAVYLLKKNRKQALLLIAVAALAILISDQSSNLIKHFIHRQRPCNIGIARLLLDHCSNGFSFTSNHAANHFVLAVLLSVVFRKSKWLIAVLLFWASGVAFSQVYVGVHYPADVMAGAMLGASIGAVMAIVYNKFLQLVD